MATKSKTAAVPVDERKYFLCAGYRLRPGSKKLELTGLDGRSTESAFATKEETVTWAKDYLSRPNTHAHYRDIDGVLVFESVAAVRPKKIEVEIDEIALT